MDIQGELGKARHADLPRGTDSGLSFLPGGCD